jgi:peptidoglycan hydrolase CwlO-like protein
MNLNEQLSALLFKLGDLVTHRADIDREIDQIQQRIAQVRGVIAMLQEKQSAPVPAPPAPPKESE